MTETIEKVNPVTKLEELVNEEEVTQPVTAASDEENEQESAEEKFVPESDKMTEDEIDEAVESGNLKPDKAEELRKQYGYSSKEEKSHTQKIERSVKGNKGNLNAALSEVRIQKSNLQTQVFHGRNKVQEAQRSLKSMEEELEDETLTGSVQKKLNDANRALNEAQNGLFLSEKKMSQLQVKEILLDEENYPAAKEVWELGKERMDLNLTEKDEAERSDNLPLTVYTIGMRSTKYQATVNKFKSKQKLSDKVAKNLEALKNKNKSPVTPAGTGGGKTVVVTPRIKELKDKIKKKTTEEDVTEVLELLEGRKK